MALRRLPASLKLPLLGLGLLLLALCAWWPTFQSLAQPSADQVWEAYGLATACLAQPSALGWMGPVPDGSAAASLFAPGLFGPVLPGLACRLAQGSALHPLQAYLLLGLAFTAVLAFISCRWAGFGGNVCLISAFLISTAPCSFSRVGHLGLAVLIPVLPTLVACLQLRRSLWNGSSPLALFGTGAVAALLTFPSQDYYVVFSVLLLFATLALLLLIASAASLELAPLAVQLRRGGLFLAGFMVVLLVVFLPKLMGAGLISFGGASGASYAGVPASWSAPRLAIEQFRYGLLPFTWLIPSPWLAATLDALRVGWVNTGSESYTMSVGSLLIPIAASWRCCCCWPRPLVCWP